MYKDGFPAKYPEEHNAFLHACLAHLSVFDRACVLAPSPGPNVMPRGRGCAQPLHLREPLRSSARLLLEERLDVCELRLGDAGAHGARAGDTAGNHPVAC